MPKFQSAAAVLAIIALAACSSPVRDEIDLMPAPDVFGNGMLNPLPQADPMELIPYRGLLYATDRAPADDDPIYPYYTHERGGVVRLGVVRMALHDPDIAWPEARELSMQSNRPGRYPIRVTGVEEFGILEDTIPGFGRRDDYGENVLDGDDEFAAAVNAQLERSKNRDIYLFVHGYRVVFENPMLVATELWHFMGYDGVMVGYAWPSTPSRWAYVKDTDTSNGFARNFRKFIKFLGKKTEARRIHVIAYSNGTQMVARAMEQLALMYHDAPPAETRDELRLGQLILVGSDLDRHVFANYLADGVLNVPEHVAVYISASDKALGFARRLTRRDRLGQLVDPDQLGPQGRRLLTESRDQLSIIDVSEAEGAATGKGHAYFRDSPWVSSDVLMTLVYGLTPEARGLQLKPDMPVYEFPPDYVSRLWATLARVDPAFQGAYERRRTP